MVMQNCGRWSYHYLVKGFVTSEEVMARRTFELTVLTLILCIVFAPPRALASELKSFTSRAVAKILDKIGPDFEKMSGHKLSIVVGLSSELVERIIGGEVFDVIAAPPPVMDRLIKAGKVAGDSKINLVRSANGVEIRAGAPKPDISSVEALKSTLLKAKSIAYLPVPGHTANDRATWVEGRDCV
jgi:molybdate transport system substrate-binding protein